VVEQVVDHQRGIRARLLGGHHRCSLLGFAPSADRPDHAVARPAAPLSRPVHPLHVARVAHPVRVPAARGVPGFLGDRGLAIAHRPQQFPGRADQHVVLVPDLGAHPALGCDVVRPVRFVQPLHERLNAPVEVRDRDGAGRDGLPLGRRGESSAPGRGSLHASSAARFARSPMVCGVIHERASRDVMSTTICRLGPSAPVAGRAAAGSELRGPPPRPRPTGRRRAGRRHAGSAWNRGRRTGARRQRRARDAPGRHGARPSVARVERSRLGGRSAPVGWRGRHGKPSSPRSSRPAPSAGRISANMRSPIG